MATMAATATGGAAMTSAAPPAPPKKPLNLDKVVALFHNQHTADLFDRQVSVLNRLCRKYTGGFFVGDLGHVREILEATAERVAGGRTEFLDPLCGIVEIARLPFRTTKANEELRSFDLVAPFVKAVSQLLDFPDNDVNMVAAETLRVYSTAMGLEADQSGLGGAVADKRVLDAHDSRPSPWEMNQSVLAASGAVEDVINRTRMEIDQLWGYDTDGDNKLSAEEVEAYRTQERSLATGGDYQFENDEGDVIGEGKGDDGAAAGEELPSADDGAGGGKTEETGGAGGAETAGLDETGAGEEQQAQQAPYLLQILLRLVRELSRHPENSASLARGGVPTYLTRLLLNLEDFRDDTLFVLVETLWNMLDNSLTLLSEGEVALSLAALLDKHRHANVLYQLGNQETVQALCGLFERILLHGFRKRDKALRNELVVMATLLSRRPANRVLFVETGFLGLALEYATAAEMELPVDANPRNFATSDPEDLELKQLLWTMIAGLCEGYEGAEALHAVRESLFIQTLLMYVDPAQANSAYLSMTWAESQKRELELLAFSLLHQLAPHCSENFSTHEGIRICVQHVRKHSNALTVVEGGPDESTVGPESAEIEGAGELGTATALEDGEDDLDRQYLALRLLQRTLPLPDEAHQDEFGAVGGVEDMVTLIRNADLTPKSATTMGPGAAASGTLGATLLVGDDEPVGTANAAPSDITPALVLEAVFSVLAASCRGGHAANQDRLRKFGGVSALVRWLRFDVEDSVTKPLLVPCVVSSVWEAVVGNKRSEARFVADDGVDALLDLVETAPRLMRGQVVGCTADLLRNPKVVPYAKAWRSDQTGRAVSVALLRLWAEEEERLGVQHGTEGAISNTQRPLDETLPGAAETAGAADSGEGGDSAPRASERLRRALKAAKMWKMVDKVPPGAQLQKAVQAEDIRPRLYAALSALGFDTLEEDVTSVGDDLTPEERASAELAREYSAFAKSQAWDDLRAGLERDGVELIDADKTHIEHRLADGREAAEAVQERQTAVLDEVRARHAEEDDAFLTTVLHQRLADEAAAKLAAQGGGPRPGGISTQAHTLSFAATAEASAE